MIEILSWYGHHRIETMAMVLILALLAMWFIRQTYRFLLVAIRGWPAAHVDVLDHLDGRR